MKKDIQFKQDILGIINIEGDELIMWNSEWLRKEYDEGRLMIVVSNAPRKNGHSAHVVRKDLRLNEWYEVSQKTGRELRNYHYGWYDIENWIERGLYREVDVKNESVSYGWKDYFIQELIDAIKEVNL